MKLQNKEIKNKPSEERIVNSVAMFFKRKGYSKQKKEFQLCERYIDLLCDNGKKMIAVEAKVNAPTQAFSQAKRYAHIADYVYVAILKNGCNKKAIELSKVTGIGLIFVKRDSLDRYTAKLEIKPKRSKKKDKQLAQYIKLVNLFK